MSNEIMKSDGNNLLPSTEAHKSTLFSERERIRQKLERLSDKALSTFEDIMDNSEDDKARNVAASKLMDIWGTLNEVTTKVAVDGQIGGSVSNIQVNINALKNTLGEATKALLKNRTDDEAIMLEEMRQEVVEFEVQNSKFLTGKPSYTVKPGTFQVLEGEDVVSEGKLR